MMEKLKLQKGLLSLRVMLFILAAIPPLYIFLAIQYSAITVPFWDHTELIRWIAAWYDGDFKFSSLWAPHNHTRPLVYRAVMLFNAVLTDWDIRSEYIYMYLAIYGTFVCHIWALFKVTKGYSGKIVYPIVLLLVSLILFSPVGHNNHWWSMMFQLNAANFFIALGLVLVFIKPEQWPSQVLAAISIWLATFTLTNGFFALISAGLTVQLTTKPFWQPTRWSLFWAINLLFLMVCYLPGIALSTSATAHPTLVQLAQFSLAYLGVPVAGLIRFPYLHMFDLPRIFTTNAICGGILIAIWLVLGWHARDQFRKQQPAAMVLIGFGLFAIISALATGWGRAAFDEYGVANGNSSRYTIFGAYLVLGQLYYCAACFSNGLWNRKGSRFIAITTISLFVSFAVPAYIIAARVYSDANNFNNILRHAFPWGLHATDQDRLIHPNPEFVKQLKSHLQRLELGPYNSRPYTNQFLPVENFKMVGLLSAGRQVSQRFIASENGLKAFAVTFVTPNGMQKNGYVIWNIVETGAEQPLAKGEIKAANIHDWDDVRIKLPYFSGSIGREYKISFSALADDKHALGIALYNPKEGQNASVDLIELSGITTTQPLSMALRLDYTK
ncbi:MAG: hypothetical protein WC782_07680 [Methylococcaceae bacterium]|jgi:hypothetical protein